MDPRISNTRNESQRNDKQLVSIVMADVKNCLFRLSCSPLHLFYLLMLLIRQTMYKYLTCCL